jgi:glyoxylase-like metal-dependent hydrolase (beta-lactamase superfamily II)
MRPTVATLAGLGLALAVAAGGDALAQPPLFETRRISDNVYLFRYEDRQSMFVVTPDGVIATDPIAFLRPQVATTYVDEIQKITQAPIRYVVYSQHHHDRIAGGKPFKALGATFVAHPHRTTRGRLEAPTEPDVVIPDETVDAFRAIELGGVRVELHYVGREHPDKSLVVLVPKDRILFVVGFIPIESVPLLDVPDDDLPDWFDSFDGVLALDWDQLIPGRPLPDGRLGTRDDVRAVKQYMVELSAKVKQAANEGKCADEAIREITLPRYEKWANYERYLGANIERFCEYWRRGH